jgi:sacsin
LDWDKPLPLEILATQLRRVLDSSLSDVQNRKIRNIIKELSDRQLGDADVQAIRTAVDGRAWIPTKSGLLAQPSRVVFVNVEDSSGFHEAAFSKIDKEIYQFLCSIGCLER